uniref:Uncharacterized protein n=1 Tax=viral metagenome TaxID=1070528 RepID=A0A6M3L671_9ZZZZ
MNIQEAKKLKSGSTVYHVTRKNADGTPMKARVTSVKTWKTRPNDVVVSVKHGLYEYIKFIGSQVDQLTK